MTEMVNGTLPGLVCTPGVPSGLPGPVPYGIEMAPGVTVNVKFGEGEKAGTTRVIVAV
jgi:hypothetical protein